MNSFSLEIGIIHFVGIGGIGMSGIAEVMHNLGYKVQGSDIAEGANVQRLQAMGINVFIGQRREHITDASVVVVSSAITKDNLELQEARARFIPVVRRAEMLAELMRLRSAIAVGGTHGKTTTTSMVATLLDGGGLDPTVINGGIINAYGTNARLGEGAWVVAEADESDGTFIKLPATIAVVTNIDPEHLDHYGSFDRMRLAFQQFVENVPFYGCAVMCTDHPEVIKLVGSVTDRRIVTYGFNPQADVRAMNAQWKNDIMTFDVVLADRRRKTQMRLDGLGIPMPGLHNVQNALAAIAVACELGISHEKIRSSLSGFGGVNRRFTKVGVWNNVAIIDDYGHHPVEISSVLLAARQASQGRVIAVVQPHRYSRLAALFEDFCISLSEADEVIVADVYPAGEDPIAGASRDDLVFALESRGHRSVVGLEDAEDLPALIRARARPGDLVIFLGAGSITQWAKALPGQLAAGS
ncbi:MAG: UDP-N-acetylmuramate--L-alanine ligase [Alphaproteobacteria bacterium]|nr:UDP-N-acetylmuramate--L-alanine ligase [Alphaproteobacteria bacterium]